ncbi:MAG TPA: ATP synthase F1 subunit delta [Candidatus Angelobacter sp.]|nr:ATP synthase F1 subunit delta [Candidatus Angelobacter sp.]
MAAVTGRYARAFAEVVVQQKLDPEKVVAELNQTTALIEGSSELRNVFENPSVEHKQKIALLDALINRMGGSRMLRNFVAVLIDHHRVGHIGEIARQFQQELDHRMGIADAQVTSSRELSTAEKKALEAQLAGVTGKKIRADYSEDPNLLGGAVVRIGSTIYDGSVRGQLERMKQQIMGIG